MSAIRRFDTYLKAFLPAFGISFLIVLTLFRVQYHEVQDYAAADCNAWEMQWFFVAIVVANKLNVVLKYDIQRFSVVCIQDVWNPIFILSFVWYW